MSWPHPPPSPPPPTFSYFRQEALRPPGAALAPLPRSPPLLRCTSSVRPPGRENQHCCLQRRASVLAASPAESHSAAGTCAVRASPSPAAGHRGPPAPANGALQIRPIGADAGRGHVLCFMFCATHARLKLGVNCGIAELRVSAPGKRATSPSQPPVDSRWPRDVPPPQKSSHRRTYISAWYPIPEMDAAIAYWVRTRPCHSVGDSAPADRRSKRTAVRFLRLCAGTVTVQVHSATRERRIIDMKANSKRENTGPARRRLHLPIIRTPSRELADTRTGSNSRAASFGTLGNSLHARPSRSAISPTSIISCPEEMLHASTNSLRHDWPTTSHPTGIPPRYDSPAGSGEIGNARWRRKPTQEAEENEGKGVDDGLTRRLAEQERFTWRENGKIYVVKGRSAIFHTIRRGRLRPHLSLVLDRGVIYNCKHCKHMLPEASITLSNHSHY
ncbi:hypothetical protein B0H17DRAFT_1186473 [Mycena rosella]|uniref:Uncharacterized protein n=1 Tax=Mycena rosella TaxID=1033263 RepID=A0AAD7G080_MYCRO|nr:hypothetical protein B0H17DRAFT_1186473 [Mycena rosella]